MGLSLEQTLQQAMTAHKQGNLKAAERLYRTILQSQPRHPDANHNLGVLAVALKKNSCRLTIAQDSGRGQS